MFRGFRVSIKERGGRKPPCSSSSFCLRLVPVSAPSPLRSASHRPATSTGGQKDSTTTVQCVCVCMCVYVCIHACKRACIHACMYVCMYVCIAPRILSQFESAGPFPLSWSFISHSLVPSATFRPLGMDISSMISLDDLRLSGLSSVRERAGHRFFLRRHSAKALSISCLTTSSSAPSIDPLPVN